MSVADVVLRTINFGSTFHDYDTSTNTATAVPRQSSGTRFASSLDTTSDGRLFGLSGTELVEFSFPAAGSTGVTRFSFGPAVSSIAFDASNRLFAVGGSTLYRFNLQTGSIENSVQLSFPGFAPSLSGLEIAANGTFYAVDSTHLFTLDPNSGAMTRFASAGLPPFSPIFTSLTSAPDGRLYATLFNTDTPLAEIDPITGLATRLGSTPTGAPYAAVTFLTAIPEPASALPATLLAIAIWRRRRAPSVIGLECLEKKTTCL